MHERDVSTALATGQRLLAPNGATYQLDQYKDQPAISRRGRGCHDLIVTNYRGERFATIEAATLWAAYDGRLARPGEGLAPFSRRLIDDAEWKGIDV